MDFPNLALALAFVLGLVVASLVWRALWQRERARRQEIEAWLQRGREALNGR